MFCRTKKLSQSDRSVWCPTPYTLFKLLLSARFCSAFLSNISDCDETFNYWEPVSKAMFSDSVRSLGSAWFSISGRHSGLTVSALYSGLSGSGSSPGQGTALCSFARHFTLIVPLSTQVYEWLLANLLLGVTLRWSNIPSRGSRNTPSRFMLWKLG